MIIIRITRVDLVLPRYLYSVIRNIRWYEVDTMTKLEYAKRIKMRRDPTDSRTEISELQDICDVMEVDNYDRYSESPSGQRLTLMRGEITISEDNEVDIIE